MYVHQFPGWGGKMLFLAATGSVFLAGAKIFDCLRFEREKRDLQLVTATPAA